MHPTKKLEIISRMAKDLRSEDREEVCAARHIKNTRPNIRAALLHSVSISEHCHFFIVNNNPLAVLGLVPQPDGRAVIWMLACNGIEHHIGDWMRWFVKYWDDYKSKYTQLYNAAYAKNETHIELIKRLNCRIGDICQKGFIPFWSN